MDYCRFCQDGIRRQLPGSQKNDSIEVGKRGPNALPSQRLLWWRIAGRLQREVLKKIYKYN
jgi:hypothetical protein